MKPKESAGCHQTISSWVGSGDETRVVVAIWLTKYCIQFLAVHVCICYKPTDFEFLREKLLSEQQVGWHHALERQLETLKCLKLKRHIYIYLCVSFHCSGVNNLHACWAVPPWTNLLQLCQGQYTSALITIFLFVFFPLDAKLPLAIKTCNTVEATWSAVENCCCHS